MRCPYDSVEQNMEQGCTTVPPTTTSTTTMVPATTTTTVTPLPELILEPGHPATTTVADSAISVELIPPAIQTRELAFTGGGEDLAVGGALALLVGCFLVWIQRRVAR